MTEKIDTLGMSLHQEYWKRKFDLGTLSDKVKLTLSGYSVAGYRTSMKINELDLHLDAGLSTHSSVSAVFITHGHADHIFSLASYVINDQNPVIYCPPNIENQLNAFLTAFYACNYDRPVEAIKSILPKKCTIVPVTSEFQFSPKGKGRIKYCVTPFKMEHSVSALGYGFSLMNSGLNPELLALGLSSTELTAAIRSLKTGTGDSKIQEIAKDPSFQVNVIKKTPQFAFLTDTTPKIFYDHRESLREYPILITECTFLAPEHYTEAKSKMHTHLDDLCKVFKEFPETSFILIHFSPRYKDDEIIELVTKKLTKSDITNKVCLWLNEKPFLITSK